MRAGRRRSPLGWAVLPGLLVGAGGAACQDGGAPKPSAERADEPEGEAPVSGPPHQTGIASFYHDGLSGRPTASGEAYDPEAFTCAHRELRLGTVVEVLRLKNGERARCRVNDRGPFAKGRIIDLSRATAEALGIDGIAKVEIRLVPTGGPGSQ